MLWGVSGPYSEAKLIKEARIMDDEVSRVFLTVEVAINPTTFELVERHRGSKEFNDDVMIQQLLDHADYRGPKFGYVSMAFSAEYDGEVDIMVNAEHALSYAKESVIKMHTFVMQRMGAVHSHAIPEINGEEDFMESVASTMGEEGHRDEYLRRVLENYIWYKNEFLRVFAYGSKSDAIYQFRVTYLLKKGVWRDIEIRGNQTFEQFARAIISAMKWNYDHMHGFTIPGIEKEPDANTQFEGATRLEFFEPHWEDDPFPTYKSDQIQIHQIDYTKHPMIEFIFDFGDGNMFEIFYRGMRDKTDIDKKVKFPIVIDQKGIAPKQYRLR